MAAGDWRGSAPRRWWSRARTASGIGAMAVVAVLAVALLSPATAAGQQPGVTSGAVNGAKGNHLPPPWRFSVRADNDAFNFWQSITQRPDKEYTNGDHVQLDVSAAPWWGPRLASGRRPCTGTERPGQRCLMTSFAIGQDMYTPRPSREPGETEDWAEDRPYAAWLYASAAGQVMSDRALRVVELEVGVTGPPAFGEMAQKTAHKLTGVYSRDPVGWETQIAFEVGAVATARETRRFAAHSASGRAIADVMPHVGVALGTVLTGAETGFTARLGYNLSNPWWVAGWSARGPLEVYLSGGARGEAVARNITLDGNTFGATRQVDRVPLVGEYSLGVGARYRVIVAQWRAITRSREYQTGPKAHAYSVLYAGIEVPTRDR